MKMTIRSDISFLIPFIAVVGISTYAYIISIQNALQIQRLDREKLKNESLLSEKLAIEKALVKSNKHLASLKVSQLHLSESLMNTQKAFTQESELLKVMDAKLSDTQFHNIQLRLLKDSLEAEISSKEEILQQTIQLNDKFNDSLLAVSHDYLKMRDRFIHEPSIDNITVLALTEKRRGGLFSKRAKRLVASFDIDPRYENLAFELSGPNGLKAHELQEKLTEVIDSGNIMTASASKHNAIVSDKYIMRKVEISYKNENRLLSGKYTFHVLNDGRQIGSINIFLP